MQTDEDDFLISPMITNNSCIMEDIEESETEVDF